MLTFNTPSGIGEIETSWEDLSPMQFVETVDLTTRFLSGKFELEDYRLLLLEMLTGYKRKRKRSKHAAQINENLFLISEHLNFAVRPKVGPAEVLDFFSPELREALKTRFPWEIHEHHLQIQLQMMKSRIQISYDINFNIGRNLLPAIAYKGRILEGPQFETSDGDIDTNLKAGAYLDAQEYYNAYSDSKDRRYLQLMIKALYVDHGNETGGYAEVPAFSDQKTQDAVLFVFSYIQQTFANDPVFSILFQKNEEIFSNKIDLGPDEAIGQLVEAGYGNYNHICQLDIRTFFNYQIMTLKRNIQSMRSAGKKVSEIAKAINLPVETIQRL